MSAAGAPSASAPSGFQLIATGVEGSKNASFFFGSKDQASSGQRHELPVRGSAGGACRSPAGQRNPRCVRRRVRAGPHALWCAACPSHRRIRPRSLGPGSALVSRSGQQQQPEHSLSNAVEFTVQPTLNPLFREEPARRKRKKPPRHEARGGFGKSGRSPTFSLQQYHRRPLLDDRVRDGNGYGQQPMVTGDAGRAARAEARAAAGRKVNWELKVHHDESNELVNDLVPRDEAPKHRVEWKKVVKPIGRLVPVS